MTHLFICREYPPAAYPPGGIGTYVRHITGLLARAGETVHVIAHRWEGAPRHREDLVDGRLVLHRVALDDPIPDPGALSPPRSGARVPAALLASRFPAQAFSWQAALVAEALIDSEGVDVVEAQEWEAPLYYLQLRRALGQGSKGRPPCVVHIHSPTERIFAANGWDTSVGDYAPAATLEEYSIQRAEAVLCPSRFVADEVLARYAVDPARVTVVPYPRGDAPLVTRQPETWSTGAICHVGRLEPRKGVLEWADAIAMVAPGHAGAQFAFVGGDTPVDVTGGATVGRAMRARLPRGVRRRVRFHGTQDRAGVLEVLSAACAAVVPSRWENFPYSCIESMSSGLPVIVSPHGGMREMIVDGASGWLAPDGTSAGLAHALTRALTASGAERQEMGETAAATIRRLCDNATIVARHLDLKTQLVRAGVRRARAARVAPAVERKAGPVVPDAGRAGRDGLGLVVTWDGGAATTLERCRDGIRGQTVPPVAVRLVCDDACPGLDAPAEVFDWQVIRRGGHSLEAAAIVAANDLATARPTLRGIVFIDGRVQLDPRCVATGAALLAADDDLGVVSGWIEEAGPEGRIHVPPLPSAPFGWHGGAVAPCVVIRAEALAAVHAASRLEAFGAAARAGWTAVTYPGVFGSVVPGLDDALSSRDAVRYSSMAGAVQRLHTPLLQWLRACSPADRRAFMAEGMRSPGRSVRWLAGRAVRAWRGSADAPPRAATPAPDRDEDRSNAERRAH